MPEETIQYKKIEQYTVGFIGDQIVNISSGYINNNTVWKIGDKVESKDNGYVRAGLRGFISKIRSPAASGQSSDLIEVTWGTSQTTMWMKPKEIKHVTE